MTYRLKILRSCTDLLACFKVLVDNPTSDKLCLMQTSLDNATKGYLTQIESEEVELHNMQFKKEYLDFMQSVRLQAQKRGYEDPTVLAKDLVAIMNMLIAFMDKWIALSTQQIKYHQSLISLCERYQEHMSVSDKKRFLLAKGYLREP